MKRPAGERRADEACLWGLENEIEKAGFPLWVPGCFIVGAPEMRRHWGKGWRFALATCHHPNNNGRMPLG